MTLECGHAALFVPPCCSVASSALSFLLTSVGSAGEGRRPTQMWCLRTDQVRQKEKRRRAALRASATRRLVAPHTHTHTHDGISNLLMFHQFQPSYFDLAPLSRRFSLPVETNSKCPPPACQTRTPMMLPDKEHPLQQISSCANTNTQADPFTSVCCHRGLSDSPRPDRKDAKEAREDGKRRP